MWSAASNGNLDLARRLLRRKNDVNEPTILEKRTALMFVIKNQAVFHNHQLMVNFLLENGAKADMIDINGKSAIDYIQETTKDKIKFMIEAHSKKKNFANKPNVRTNSF